MQEMDLSIIYDTTDAIKAYQYNSSSDLYDLCKKIADILYLWTGNTWVGIEKASDIKTAFQDFFVAFEDFIRKCAVSNNKNELSLSENTIYRGIIYRYIGAKTYDDEAPEVKYNDVYVSWSKAKYNSYIYSHIHAAKTWIKCEIPDSLFGIDIEGFEKWCKKHFDKRINISKGDEKEVVFPTKKNCILEIVKPFKCNTWAENGYSCECCREEMEYSEFLECSGLEK